MTIEKKVMTNKVIKFLVKKSTPSPLRNYVVPKKERRPNRASKYSVKRQVTHIPHTHRPYTYLTTRRHVVQPDCSRIHTDFLALEKVQWGVDAASAHGGGELQAWLIPLLRG